MASKNGGRLVVDGLRNEGVRRVFTVPGESFLPVLDALFDEAGAIEVVSTRHEGGAGFMADGYAKASGEVGVCMVTRGVGAGNLSIALHTARQDSTPMVALVGQVPTEARYREAFQEVDLVRHFTPLVKWAVEIPTTERIPELIQQAFRVARSERPGPVVVGLPEDILFAVAERPPERPSIRIRPPRPSRDAVVEALDLIGLAERPVLLVGREVLTTGSSGLVVELAEKLALPVMTAFRRFDAYPNDHRNYVGNIAFGTPAAMLQPLEEADLVVGLGTRFSEITTAEYRYPLPETPVLHVSASPETVGVRGHAVTPVVSDVKLFLEDLLELAESREAGPSAERSTSLRNYRKEYERLSEFDAEAPIRGTSISGVLESISERAPDNTALSTDAGNFSGWVARYYPFRQPFTHFGPTSGAMGYGLPGAIGVSFADRSRLVFALAGDGGFAMTMNELAVVKQYELPVVALVFVNESYGTIRMHQEKHFPGRPVATDLENPSFVAIGRAFGIDSFRICSNSEFDGVLDELIGRPRPALIEIVEGEERLTAWGNLQ